MNVVVMIQGREAIPVRAIPLLTDWEVLSPDELAGALTGDYSHNPSFEKLTAHSSEDGHLKDVKPRWWSNFPVRQLEALSHRIKHKEISHDDGYEQWRRESLPVLPSGVFVWKDEFEACFWSAYGPDGEIEWVAVEGGFKIRKRKEFIELDFEPLVSPEFSDLVMKGFEAQATYNPAPESQTKPVGADSASNSTTPDPERRLARLRVLGGNAAYKRGEWNIVGISVLVASEKSEGRKRSDEKTIRADLKEAAENEREAKRANAFSGLGQR